MSRYTVQFAGVLISRAPITVSYPEKSYVDQNNNWLRGLIKPTDEYRNQSVDGVKFEGDRPILQASAARGALRGAACAVAIENQSLSYADTNMNYMGGQNPTKQFPQVEAIAIREKNPIMAVFGGCSPTFIGGSFKSGNAYARYDGQSLAKTQIVRRDAIDRDPKNLFNRLKDPSERDDYMAFAAEMSARKSQNQRDRQIAFREENQASREKTLATLDKSFEDDNKTIMEKYGNRFHSQDVRQLHTVFAIPSNTTFDHRMRMVQATEIEIGLLAATLQSMAFTGGWFVGGREASGNGGQMRFEYKAVAYNHDTNQREDWGSIKLTEDDEFIASDQILACLAAFNEAKANGQFDFEFKGGNTANDDEAPVATGKRKKA